MDELVFESLEALRDYIQTMPEDVLLSVSFVEEDAEDG